MPKLLRLLLLIIACTVAGTESRAEQHTNLIEILSEAEDYISVKPSKTIELLTQKGDLTSLSTPEKIRWHIAIIRASVPTNNPIIFEQSLEQVLKFKKHQFFDEKLYTILSGIGIWLRKHHHYAEAKVCLMCALEHTNDPRIKAILMNSLALLLWDMGDTDAAKNTLIKAKDIALERKLTSNLAMLENNLGLLAFEQDNLNEAEARFRSAYALSQSISKRATRISSGVNLLYIFYVKGETLNYQRLLPTMIRLTDAFPNKEKKANVLLLNSAFKVDNGAVITPKQELELKMAYSHIISRKQQMVIVKYLSEKLSINFQVAAKAPPSPYDKDWLAGITQCDWPRLAELPQKQWINSL